MLGSARCLKRIHGARQHSSTGKEVSMATMLPPCTVTLNWSVEFLPNQYLPNHELLRGGSQKWVKISKELKALQLATANDPLQVSASEQLHLQVRWCDSAPVKAPLSPRHLCRKTANQYCFEDNILSLIISIL